MFNGCLCALPHCVPCCYHVKCWKGRGMGNFGRGRAGAGVGGWDGDGQVTKKKVFDPCVRRSSQQKWSGGWRVAVLTRSPGLQVYTQTNVHTNKSMAKISTYIHDMYVHIHDVSSHVYKYRCFLLFQVSNRWITYHGRFETHQHLLVSGLLHVWKWWSRRVVQVLHTHTTPTFVLYL